MKNIIFVSIIGLGLLSAIIGLILAEISTDYHLIDMGSNISEYGVSIGGFVGFIMLVSNGTFIKTKYFQIFKGIFSVVVIGTLIKIMHWPYANLIVSIGLFGILVTYILSFLKKPLKIRLDYIKLLWVTLGYAFVILQIYQLISRGKTQFTNYILWLAIIDFIVSGHKNGTLFLKEPNSNDI